jgi:hypothetical protein
MAEATAIKSCPMCGNDAPAHAPRCTCGYVFAAKPVTEAVEWEPGTASGEPGDGWRTAGWIFAVVGGLGLAFGLFSGITIDGGYGGDDIVNLDLMFHKGVILACSLSAIGLGVFCLGVGAIVKALGRKS